MIEDERDYFELSNLAESFEHFDVLQSDLHKAGFTSTLTLDGNQKPMLKIRKNEGIKVSLRDRIELLFLRLFGWIIIRS